MALRVHRTLTTTTAPEAVYGFLADFENAEAWDPGTVSCRRISGDGGTGSTYRNVSSFLGRRTELTYVAEDLAPGRLVHFRGSNGSFEGEDRILLAPHPDGTELSYEAVFRFSGAATLAIPVVAAYLPFLATRTMQQLQRTLDSL